MWVQTLFLYIFFKFSPVHVIRDWFDFDPRDNKKLILLTIIKFTQYVLVVSLIINLSRWREELLDELILSLWNGRQIAMPSF